MSLVTPDLKQEQDGRSSLVDAVGGRGQGGRSLGAGGGARPLGQGSCSSLLKTRQLPGKKRVSEKGTTVHACDTTVSGTVFTGTVCTRG